MNYELQNIIDDQQDQIHVMKQALEKYSQLFKSKKGVSQENQELLHKNTLLVSEIESLRKYKQLSEDLAARIQEYQIKEQQMEKEINMVTLQKSETQESMKLANKTIDRLQLQVQQLQKQLYQWQCQNDPQNVRNVLSVLDNYIKDESIFVTSQANQQQFLLSNQQFANISYQNLNTSTESQYNVNCQPYARQTSNEQEHKSYYEQIHPTIVQSKNSNFTQNMNSQRQQIEYDTQIPQQLYSTPIKDQQQIQYTNNSISQQEQNNCIQIVQQENYPEYPILSMPSQQSRQSKNKTIKEKIDSNILQIQGQTTSIAKEQICTTNDKEIPLHVKEEQAMTDLNETSPFVEVGKKTVNSIQQDHLLSPQYSISITNSTIHQSQLDQLKNSNASPSTKQKNMVQMYTSKGEKDVNSIYENSIDNQLVECSDDALVQQNQFLKEDLYFAKTTINQLTCEETDIIFASLPSIQE
ncbi:hypothetical protein SS50377_21237 [Spironucleus salmonicida]|uniref:Uncharacterized protein n=1 Tax=Spironucleus salmonicida TaxID=348837 RepID=V6LT94_9EUKA|nr:hypothetical protein SS50377_21237 [Spironucleus salmonicida]|eukprot:EST44009.1 Hypothetical protein SS50377_16318 [Spironucleus salmonicida]